VSAGRFDYLDLLRLDAAASFFGEILLTFAWLILFLTIGAVSSFDFFALLRLYAATSFSGDY
jgi:hypothetical protein